LEEIANNVVVATTNQERRIYGAFSIILGQDLTDVLISLNCKTEGLSSLVDLLNPIKLFPNSYKTLTVPIYNTVGGPANSKIYYPIYVGDGLNSQLRNNLSTNVNSLGGGSAGNSGGDGGGGTGGGGGGGAM
jgi:uncharacterized membrane protein YgcG